MKTIIIASLSLLVLVGNKFNAQETEKYGNTLNLGVGIGYYGYLNNYTPVGHINYEFDVARNFTLAPFATVFTNRDYRRWDKRDYYYQQTVIPVGVKGSYYFDQLFHASSKWDFYAAGSAGVVFRLTTWEDGYYGERNFKNTQSGVYLDAHVGAEYHFNSKVGMFLDLSTGISTFGFAFHL